MVPGFIRPYGAFAGKYDELMSHVPYIQWASAALGLINQNIGTGTGAESMPTGHRGPRRLRILDLACGTGAATMELARAGHRLVGLDISEEMLSIASARAFRSLSPAWRPMFVHGDMMSLPFEGGFDAVTCFCDGFNHLRGIDDLGRAFESIRGSMVQGGILVFDLNTPYKLGKVLGDNTFVEEFDGGMCIMDNHAMPDTHNSEIRLTFFKESGAGLYTREDEVHTEAWFDGDCVSELLSASGFEGLGTWDGYGLDALSEHTERAVYAARAV